MANLFGRDRKPGGSRVAGKQRSAAPRSCAWQKPSQYSWLACVAPPKRLVSRNASESSASWLRRSLLATIRSPFVIAFRFLRARRKTTDRQQLAIKITFCVRGVVSSLLANVYLHYVFDLWADVVPRESVIAFREEMRLAQANWQINIYGEAKHSFTGEGVVGNRTPEAGLHPQTEARSWQTTVEFLREVFE